MKLTKTKRSHHVVFNITPMIDIVFLLIIFFMTVSQITRVVDQPLSLPVVASGAKNEQPATVTINLDREGRIVVAGKEFELDHTLRLLREKLEQLKNDVSKLRIELRCDRRCPGKYVNAVVDRLTGIGILYVTIAVAGEN